MKRYKLIRDALELSLLFLPLMSLSDLVRAFLPLPSDFCALPLASVPLCFFAALSESGTDAAKKWGLSLPFTVGFWILLGLTDFDLRLFNTLHPGYGNLPAGGGFAILFQIPVYFFLQGVAILLAASLSCGVVRRLGWFRFLIQDVLLPAVCGLLLAAIVWLELTMPSWESFYQLAYG